MAQKHDPVFLILSGLTTDRRWTPGERPFKDTGFSLKFFVRLGLMNGNLMYAQYVRLPPASGLDLTKRRLSAANRTRSDVIVTSG